MKSYIITIEGNKVSEKGAALCISTSKKVKNDINIEIFPAVTPAMAKTVMTGNGLKWNYPWEGKETDLATGLIKSAYQTKNKDARIACSMSHWLLWYKCMTEDVPHLIMEHDCMFIERLDWKLVLESKFDIIGINSPAAATRLAHKFHDIVQDSPVWAMPVPTIDEFNIPQGLAGNSAYIIKPAGAKNLIEASRKHGLWPNDALMCKQIIPNMGVTKTYFTRVQGLPSTTSQ